MTPHRQTIGLAASVTIVACSAAAAQPLGVVIMDDTSDGVAAPLELDYDLATAGVQGAGSTSNDFSGDPPPGGDVNGMNGFLLAPDAILITFDLAAGLFIQDFSVVGEDFVDAPGGTTITFTGVEVGGGTTSETISIDSAGAFSVGTFQPGLVGQPSTDFASITSVEIASFEVRLNRFDYVIAPAPSSAAGLALAGVLATRRRRN